MNRSEILKISVGTAMILMLLGSFFSCTTPSTIDSRSDVYYVDALPVRRFNSNAEILEFVKTRFNPNYNNCDELTKLKILMDFISQLTPVSNHTDGGNYYLREPYVTTQYIYKKEYSTRCGGQAALAVNFLRLFGFKSALINLLDETNNGHTANAVLLNTYNKFIFVDFYVNNFIVDDRNVPLSFAEIFHRDPATAYPYEGSKLKLMRSENPNRLELLNKRHWSFYGFYKDILKDANWVFNKIVINHKDNYWKVYHSKEFSPQEMAMLQRDCLVREGRHD